MFCYIITLLAAFTEMLPKEPNFCHEAMGKKKVRGPTDFSKAKYELLPLKLFEENVVCSAPGLNVVHNMISRPALFLYNSSQETPKLLILNSV